jgi:hypothetical protein
LRRFAFLLQPGEHVRWQACPAPRAYTFRRWRLPLACLVAWLALSLCQAATRWRPELFLAWLLAGGGVLLPLLLARLRWRGEGYQVTDRRVLVRRGLWRSRLAVWPLASIVRLELQPLGGTLSNARLWFCPSGKPLTLYCLEQGEALAAALGQVSRAGGKSVDRVNLA